MTFETATFMEFVDEELDELNDYLSNSIIEGEIDLVETSPEDVVQDLLSDWKTSIQLGLHKACGGDYEKALIGLHVIEYLNQCQSEFIEELQTMATLFYEAEREDHVQEQ